MEGISTEFPTFTPLSLDEGNQSYAPSNNESVNDDHANHHHHRIIAIVVYTVVFFVGGIGNAVVIWIIGFKMKKTTATVLFLNLSIADFLFILCLPFSITQAIMEYHWIFGWFFCKLNSYIMFVNMYASIFFLTVIGLERYIAVVHPVQGMKIRTLRNAFLVVGVTWTLACLLSTPAFLYRNTHMDEEGFVSCYNHLGEDHESTTARISQINICRAVVGFIIPFTVMFFCYSRVACKMRRIHFAKKRKSFKLIVLVVLAFFICWAPYHVLSIMDVIAYQKRDYDLFVLTDNVFPVAISIAFVNSCINPILYVFSGQNFQDKIRMSLSKAIELAFSEMTRESVVSESRPTHGEAGFHLKTEMSVLNVSG
uniref:chemerin-like receptor 2 n=1 Tax=Myxine glutinosa TaxID=7769 RepID=UPI00358F44C3